MLQRLKSDFRELKKGIPGRRFVEHYERRRQREHGKGNLWKTVGFVIAGLLLLILGLLLSIPPGFPGFLLWIPGLGLLAARLKSFAIFLDRLELLARKVWHWVRTRRRR